MIVSTKLSNPEWESLVDKCNEKGITLVEYIGELFKNDTVNKKPVESVEVKNIKLYVKVISKLRI